MDKALSLYSCSLVSIKELLKIDKNDKKTLIDYAKNQYVCPTCFKPLFPKSIYSNYSKPHFSHYEREEVETNCPNRRDSKNKNNSKKYLRDNRQISKEIFRDVYIKASIIHIKKSIINNFSEVFNIRNFNDFNIEIIKGNPIKLKITFFDNAIDKKTPSIININNLNLNNKIQKLAKLIFKDDKNKTHNCSEKKICNLICSDLIDEIKKANTNSNKDTILNILDEIFATISITDGFNVLQEYLIWGALLFTFLKYLRFKELNLNKSQYLINFDEYVKYLPIPIKNNINTLFSLLDNQISENNLSSLSLEEILRSQIIMTSIKERLIWFFSQIKFKDVNLSDFESLENTNSENRSPGYIYIAHSIDLNLIYKKKNVIKIGRSKNPIKREIALTGQLLNNPIKIYTIWKVENQFFAENLIFSKLSNYRLKSSREIFQLSKSSAKEMINEILLKSNQLVLN